MHGHYYYDVALFTAACRSEILQNEIQFKIKPIQKNRFCVHFSDRLTVHMYVLRLGGGSQRK
jgi:hypothetical protein